jgi:Protein of unknown function (DUF2971)
MAPTMNLPDRANALFFYSFDSPPPVLYHYTSMDGLLGIARSGAIRATHVRYLNDTTETTWMWSIVVQQLIRTRDSTKDDKARDQLTTLLESIESRSKRNDFVSSFSENGDDLSQWRAYCPGAVGYSIGFDSSALQTQWVLDPAGGDASFVGATLCKIRYISEDNDGAITDLLGGLLEAAPDLRRNFEDQRPDLHERDVVVAWLSVVAPSFKHAAFSSEREWRLVISKPHKPMPGQRFRPGKSSIVPFIEMELNRDGHGNPRVPYMIREVRVGPSPDPQLSVDALKAMFLSLGHPEVQIEPSSIPYRHW